MKSKLPDSSVAAWRGLLTVQARVVSQVETSLAKAGLPTLSWYDVLLVLYEAPGRQLRMADLAEGVLLSRSGLTRLVDKLEAEGHLVREACATDKRGWNVTLTDKGHEVLRQVWPVYSAAIAAGFADQLSADDFASLNRIWGKILPQS